MGYLVVGSVAANYWNIIRERKPLDLDIISDYGSAITLSDDFGGVEREEWKKSGVVLYTKTGKIIEVELTDQDTDWSRHSRKLYDTICERDSGTYISPEWLLFLKMSHRYLRNSPHFMKTILDIREMRLKGVELPQQSEQLMKEREELTYDYSHPNLNVKRTDFFKDDVPYQFDHDDIHRKVAILDRPAYTFYMREGSEVMTSKEKFFDLPEKLRLLGGLEEAMVLCAERSLIPHNWTPDPDKMFVFALTKVCTSITSGWFREYCYDNFFKILDMYTKLCKDRWSQELKKKVDNGELLLYNSGSM